MKSDIGNVISLVDRFAKDQGLGLLNVRSGALWVLILREKVGPRAFDD